MLEIKVLSVHLCDFPSLCSLPSTIKATLIKTRSAFKSRMFVQLLLNPLKKNKLVFVMKIFKVRNKI